MLQGSTEERGLGSYKGVNLQKDVCSTLHDMDFHQIPVLLQKRLCDASRQ